MPETLLQDIRYALRWLRRSPVFTATAILSLAIGIGANATIFSVASALLLRPLPGLDHPGRLVDIGRTTNGGGFDNTSYPNYRDLRDRATMLTGIYAFRFEPEPMSLGGRDEAERVYGTRVTGNYFQVLGTHSQRGRLFTDADDQPGRNHVVVLASDLWRRRFGGDPSIVGKTILITGEPFMVVGVAPPGFQGTTVLRADLFLPLSTQVQGPSNADMLTNRRIIWLMMGGRLKPGVTVAQANAEVDAIGKMLARQYPQANGDKGLRVVPTSIFPGRIGIIAGFIGLLMGIVALVFLIACVNVAGMLLARSAARRREIAVRLAIGAGRARLIRQLLTETLVLFAAGCAVGLLISRWLIALLLSLLPQLPVPIGMHIAVDWRVLAFAVVLSLVAAILAGLAPALQASRPDVVPALKAEGLGSAGGKLRLRNVFVVGQITLSLVIVIAGGLFMRALEHAASIDPGFDQSNIDVVSLDLSLARYKDAAGIAFARQLVSRARALPGVQGAVIAADLPLDGDRIGFGDVRLPGTSRETRRTAPPVDWNTVTPGFFRLMHVPLLRGRDFDDRDDAGAPPVVIVNAALAQRFWGRLDVTGRELVIDTGFDEPRRVTVVGVATNARFVDLDVANLPYIYAPLAQEYHPRVSLLVKTSGTSLVPEVRSLMRELNPQLPIVNAMPMTDVTAIGLVPQRIAASVAGTLGIVGLLLAAIGIYGVTAYAVGRRTREIGIRMALGANRAAVLRLVLRQGLVLTLLGIGIGVVLGALGSGILRGFLLGVSALDPLTFGGAVLLFTVIALTATYFPARRATRVDPISALRQE
ncbi:MAG TPA: ABC transporter permease [Vicinamibacterales bacterium]|nr:ABC transporter permease [Vicinamibacterales bacterium]